MKVWAALADERRDWDVDEVVGVGGKIERHTDLWRETRGYMVVMMRCTVVSDDGGYA